MSNPFEEPGFKHLIKENPDRQLYTVLDRFLMSELGHALERFANQSELINACISRNLIPMSVGHSLNMAHFLSRVVVAARLAMSKHGVPASFLIGEAVFCSGYLSDVRRNNYFQKPPGDGACGDDDPATAMQFGSIEACFLHRAMTIAGDPRLRSAMALAADPFAFTEEVCRVLSRSHDAEDISTIMVTFELHECDGEGTALGNDLYS